MAHVSTMNDLIKPFESLAIANGDAAKPKGRKPLRIDVQLPPAANSDPPASANSGDVSKSASVHSAPALIPTKLFTPRSVCEEIGPTDFVTLMREHGDDFDDTMLVIDVRSFFIYEKEHVLHSINVSLPRALVGKKPISLERVEELVSGDGGKSSFRDRASRIVIVYDDVRESRGERPANSLVQLLVEEDAVKDVFILQGGFANFLSLHPDMCVVRSADDEVSPFIVPLDNPNNTEQIRSYQRQEAKLSLALTIPTFQLQYQGDEPSEVLPHRLYIGSDRNASNLTSLTSINVNCILNMAKECLNHFPDKFQYKNVHIYDDPDQDLAPYMDESVEYIANAIQQNKTVFVHCYMGVSRSATVVLVYLMRYERMTLQAAYELLRERRPRVCPNSGFMGYLIKFERKLFGSCSLNQEEYAPLLLMSQDEDDPRPGLGVAALDRFPKGIDMAPPQTPRSSHGGAAFPSFFNEDSPAVSPHPKTAPPARTMDHSFQMDGGFPDVVATTTAPPANEARPRSEHRADTRVEPRAEARAELTGKETSEGDTVLMLLPRPPKAKRSIPMVSIPPTVALAPCRTSPSNSPSHSPAQSPTAAAQ